MLQHRVQCTYAFSRNRSPQYHPQGQKTVSVKLVGGEVVQGWIEYYDKNMVRLTRQGAPNLFIFKHEIMYIAEEPPRR